MEKIKVDKQNKKEKVKEKNLVNYSFVYFLGIIKYLCNLI